VPTSVEINDTMRDGPACTSTWLITVSDWSRVVMPVKWLRTDAGAGT